MRFFEEVLLIAIQNFHIKLSRFRIKLYPLANISLSTSEIYKFVCDVGLSTTVNRNYIYKLHILAPHYSKGVFEP